MKISRVPRGFDLMQLQKKECREPPDFGARMNKMTDEELKERPLELGSSDVTGRRSNQLNYAPAVWRYLAFLPVPCRSVPFLLMPESAVTVHYFLVTA